MALTDGLAWGWLDCYVLGVFVLAWWGSGANDESGVVFDPALRVHEL